MQHHSHLVHRVWEQQMYHKITMAMHHTLILLIHMVMELQDTRVTIIAIRSSSSSSLTILAISSSLTTPAISRNLTTPAISRNLTTPAISSSLITPAISSSLIIPAISSSLIPATSSSLIPATSSSTLTLPIHNLWEHIKTQVLLISLFPHFRILDLMLGLQVIQALTTILVIIRQLEVTQVAVTVIRLPLGAMAVMQIILPINMQTTLQTQVPVLIVLVL